MLREAYRLNKTELADFACSANFKANLLFTLNPAAYTGYRDLKFADISENMAGILKKIKSILEKK